MSRVPRRSDVDTPTGTVPTRHARFVACPWCGPSCRVDAQLVARLDRLDLAGLRDAFHAARRCRDRAVEHVAWALVRARTEAADRAQANPRQAS